MAEEYSLDKKYIIPDEYIGTGIGGQIGIDDNGWIVLGGKHNDGTGFPWWKTSLRYKWIELNDGTIDCQWKYWTARGINQWSEQMPGIQNAGAVKLSLGNGVIDGNIYGTNVGDNAGANISGAYPNPDGFNTPWSFITDNNKTSTEAQLIRQGESFTITAYGTVNNVDNYNKTATATIVFTIPDSPFGNYVHIYSQISGESNASWHKYRPWIYNGTTWQKAKPFVYNNGWKQCR